MVALLGNQQQTFSSMKKLSRQRDDIFPMELPAVDEVLWAQSSLQKKLCFGGQMDTPSWYAVTVKPQHEFRVLKGLEALGGPEAFLPVYKEQRKWTDRVRTIEVPLFRGYVFVRFPFKAWQIPVLRVAGVRSIVMFDGKPARISDKEIFNIRQLYAEDLAIQPWPFVQPGDRIRIEHGPLRGVEGIIVRQKDSWHMVVSITMLNRSIAATLDRSALQRIGPLVIVH